jgi:hypothetical protein
MDEVFEHTEHVEVWRAAIRGEPADLEGLMKGYVASVDWPGAAFWRELASLFPDSLVLLSVRESPEAWWRSVSPTIFEKMRHPAPPTAPLPLSSGMIEEMTRLRFTPDWNDREGAVAAYERHNESVRRAVAPKRLLEWQPGDGWAPLCMALGMPIPKIEFPHMNSAKDVKFGSKWDPNKYAEG